MKGIYRFYQNGELIHEQENLLTTEGKKLILRYLAGQAGNIGDALAVGVAATAPTASDYRLNFEIDRVVVSLKNADYANQYVIFKGTLPQASEYTIYEVGLFSNFANGIAGDYSSRALTVFDTTVETWTNSTVDTTGPRTSTASILVTAGASATVSTRTSTNMDLSGYSGNDEFTLAFNKTTANITTLALAFENSTGGVFKRSLSISALPLGYNVLAFKKSDFTATGTIDWGTITSFGVDVTANASGGSIILDGIRVEDTDTINPNYVLVSRALLGAPLAKTAVAPLDIEYALDVSIP